MGPGKPCPEVLGSLRRYGDLDREAGGRRECWGGGDGGGGRTGTEKSPKVTSLEDNDKFSVSTEDRTRGNGLNFTAGGMAVRPQEELPGLEGSSEVIPSLSLPPGRTAPSPASLQTGASPSWLSKEGDHPASLPHLSPGAIFLHQGHFLRFNLDPWCCGPQPVACVSRGWVSSGPLLSREFASLALGLSAGRAPRALLRNPSPTALPPSQGR